MNNPTFDALKSIAGWDDNDCARVSITGSDPVLATRFPVGEVAAGTHSACGLAAAKLWELRTGRSQSITVDVRPAAATLRSYSYLRLPAPVGLERSASPAQMLGGFCRTRDGRWFFVHTGFPHLRAGVLKLLACDDNVASCNAAVARWDSGALEDAFAEKGLCGAIVRTAAEWKEHPQARALTPLSLVRINKIGTSPPEPLHPGDRPLAGVRALDLTRVLAGPTCGRTLAEYGADILKISARDLPTSPLFDIDTGHGKRTAYLDLRIPDDAATLWKLTEQADVFCQSYRLGALSGRGFSPEEVVARRPGIVYAFMNCYGPLGPWAGRRGWEQLAQTVSGLAHEEGQFVPDPTAPNAPEKGKPRLLPAAVTDYLTGYLLAFGVMVALCRRAVNGGSYLVSTSLTQTGMFIEKQRRLSEAEVRADVKGFSSEEIARMTMETDSAFGRISFLAPAVKMSETPARWALPPSPLGTHQAVWMERS